MRWELGKGEGTVWTEKIFFKKEEGREREPQEEGPTKGGKGGALLGVLLASDHCFWLTPPSGSLGTLAMTAVLVTCQGSL